MVFSGLTFLFLFLPLLYLLLFLSPRLRWQNAVLTVFSLIFYAWGEPVWVLAMLFSTGVNYLCARRICLARSEGARRCWLVIGVVCSVCFLFYFKYAAFLFNSLSSLLQLGVRMRDVALPIGISFYTFQILTYTVDVYRGKAPEQKNPLDLLLYISCFPQLIAGPIVQYADVAEQLEKRRVTPSDFAEGIGRFAVGLAKKVLLANFCGAALGELSLGGSGAMSLAGAWSGAFLYTLQIYFDFSAYSDMAIGLGRTLGFRYKENFDHPYASRSITEFWRRWHISLGSFFRDYVYIPLGGNRCGTAKTIRNMAIVWLLTGFWHGASWNFLLWGGYYALLLIAERFVLKRALERLPALCRIALTFLLVVLGWVIFYYTDLAALREHLCAMLGIGVPLTDAATGAMWQRYSFFPPLAYLLSLPVLPRLAARLPERLSRILSPCVTLCLFLLSVLFLIGSSYNPFIYFRF